MTIIDKYLYNKKVRPNPYVKKMIDKYLTIINGRSIDIGCGDGRNSFYLKENFNFTCDLFDPDENKVSLAKSIGLINAITQKAELFNYDKNIYDVALYINSAMYISLDNQIIILNKIINSLKAYDSLLIYSVMTNWHNDKRNVLEDEEVISILKTNNFIMRDKNNFSQGNKKFTMMVFVR